MIAYEMYFKSFLHVQLGVAQMLDWLICSVDLCFISNLGTWPLLNIPFVKLSFVTFDTVQYDFVQTCIHQVTVKTTADKTVTKYWTKIYIWATIPNPNVSKGNKPVEAFLLNSDSMFWSSLVEVSLVSFLQYWSLPCFIRQIYHKRHKKCSYFGSTVHICSQ